MKFGYAVLLLSQGMPFLEGGAEMGRTKGGNPNSYNAGDAVNAYKWSELPTYEGLVDYTSQLIRLRLAHPAFRIRSAAMIRDHVHVVRDGMPDGSFGLLINGAGVGDSWKSIFVIVHGRWDPGTVVRLPPGSWRVKLDAGGPADVEASGQMQLQPLTVTVLAQ